MDDATRLAWMSLKLRLGLDSEDETYRVVYAFSSFDPQVIALRTRSILDFAGSLSPHVDVPEKHLLKGAVSQIVWAPATREVEGFSGKFHVRSGNKAPQDAYAAVPYRDHWFWVEDTDLHSKNNIQSLLFLLQVTESNRQFDTRFIIKVNN